jgi:hypothetical protein
LDVLAAKGRAKPPVTEIAAVWLMWFVRPEQVAGPVIIRFSATLRIQTVRGPRLPTCLLLQKQGKAEK